MRPALRENDTQREQPAGNRASSPQRPAAASDRCASSPQRSASDRRAAQQRQQPGATSAAARAQQPAATGDRTTCDRRSARTRRALRDALAAEIARTGDLSQVTVTAVTDRAGVTRRTFYSHFRDIPDLVNQVEDETLQELRPLVAKLASVHLDQLEDALQNAEPCPGSVEILDYFRDRKGYLAPLLGDGGDPAFVERVKRMAREVVSDRALDGLDLRAVGTFFDYYLTFAISAEVGVLVRWLANGAHESTEAMARVMLGLMFVRPGDLYGKTIDFNVPAFGLALLSLKEENDDQSR